MGFSKGCAVLNQVLCDIRTLFDGGHEAAAGHADTSLTRFAADTLRRMVWLDGGHNGREVTWLGSEKTILEAAVRHTKVNFDVRVTPYQVRCVPRFV